MTSVFKTWSGDEWQAHIFMLLKRHYAPGQFQEIPDKHRGDAGLEGFSNDGCAYQCYSPEEPLDIAGRLKAHKQKIYRDIQKFCKNSAVLVQLLGQTKVKCWILVVPIFDSKETIGYGEMQAADVRKLSLPHVDASFCIRIMTDDQFAVERQQLMGVGLAKVRINPIPPASAEVEQWLTNNSGFVRTLDGKLARMKPKTAAAKRNELRRELIAHFVNGQNAIALLHENHGELYERVIQLKAQHEQFLVTESMTATGLPTEILGRTVAAYGSKLESELLGVDSHTAKILVWEAIADWLLRCPLNFEEAA